MSDISNNPESHTPTVDELFARSGPDWGVPEEEGGAEEAAAERQHGGGGIFRKIAWAIREHRLAALGLGIIVFVVIFCFIGPIVYPTDQVHTNLLQANQPPSRAHPLGTDAAGYDVLGRLMLAGQTSLEVGLAAALLASVWGTAWGAVSGFLGGWVDSVMMRLVDSILSIPPLLLIMLFASIYGPKTPVLIVVIALVSWLGTARLVRGEALSLRVRDYVHASRLFGSSSWWIVLRHIVPNVIGTIVVQTTFAVADAILALSALGYLGLGPPPPGTDWGGMLTDGLNYVYSGYWWLIYPAGVAIVLTVVAFNFVGDSLRDAFDVRLRQR